MKSVKRERPVPWYGTPNCSIHKEMENPPHATAGPEGVE